MHHSDIGEFLDLIARYRVTHTFLPPTVIYMLLDHPKLESADLNSLQCFWYGAASCCPPLACSGRERDWALIGLARISRWRPLPLCFSAWAS
jgi:acyl-CoA synthetase (AMP-forming)/AMP-acid ligase II